MQTRRRFIRQTACSLSAAVIATTVTACSPRLARAQGQEYTVLSPEEVAILDALGDTLMPGAAEAGIAHFVDSQLANDVPLLMLNYLDFPMTLVNFYKEGLKAIGELAAREHQAEFTTLDPELRDALIGRVASGAADPWSGPPAPLFYFALRADVVDVCFGTEAGFAELDIPYLPHISPRTPW